jgi:hypothetical protein
MKKGRIELTEVEERHCKTAKTEARKQMNKTLLGHGPKGVQFQV